MRIKRTGEIGKILVLVVLLVLAAALAIAAGLAPTFTPTPPSLIVCYQNSTCTYDFNATDNESDPINFSIDTPPFSQNINADTGVLNFTPTNDDVGRYNYTWAIVKETDTGNGSIAIITWIIENINDPPEILDYYPENLTGIDTKENSWEYFNVTATDIDISFGDNITYTWLVDGYVNLSVLNSTNHTGNYTPDFFSAGTHNITVNVTDTGNLSASVSWIVNVTNENRAPVLALNISNISMLEDTPLYNIFNLDDHFYDFDFDDYPLSYDAVFISANNMTIYINTTEPNNVSIVPVNNFFGTNTVRFRCYDGYNYTSSNDVTINVTGVNDVPVVTQLPNQTAYADTLYIQQVEAYDPDYDSLTFYDNSPLFNINPSTGFISQIFNIAQIGDYQIVINVSDGKDNTSMIFNLSIINNSAPVIGGKPLPTLTTTEGTLTTFYFNATDADEIDTLTFSSSSSPQNPKFNLITTNNSATNGRAYMQFTPAQADVGEWPVTINVTDNKGALDTETFTINITNVEHAPVLATITDQRMKVNLTFSMSVTATDEDGNLHLFGDNTTLFDIATSNSGQNATGSIIFTPNDSQVGEHWVNITINDSTSNYDWQIVMFNVTYNTPPTLQPISNQTTLEDFLFELQVNASDPDPQDTLIYYDNTSLFNVSSTGLISFTPNASQTGEYIINITVSDGYANVSTPLNLTIGVFNDVPYWIPPLNNYFVNSSIYMNTTTWDSTNILNYSTNMTIWNSSIYEKNLTKIYMDAYDEETSTLSFNQEYINFTNASNDTVTTGITLLNITSDSGHVAFLNFTPNNSQVGQYYVNFTIYDGEKVNYTVVKIIVDNVNDAPTIISKTPNVTDYVNMTENSSMLFNVSAIDVDYGDTLHYKWALDGNNITGANKSYYNYTTNFFSAGWHNITIFVLDNHNKTTNLTWRINVSNVNRLGWFGELREYNYTHFNAGLTKINLTTLSGEQGVTIYLNGTGYRPSGLFESQILDTGETNLDPLRHQFTTVNWTGDLTPPASAAYSAYFQTRTDEGETQVSCPAAITTNYSEMYTVQNSQISSESLRCIQYKFVMTTNNSDYTPNIKTVTLGYKLADVSIEQDNSGWPWIDLDTYFFDLDTDDNRTYNVTGINVTNLSTAINISIDPSTHRVLVNTVDSELGSISVRFSMYDQYNYTYSNIVTINITETETYPDVIIVPVGGGGSVSQPVPYEVPKYVSTPVSFRLITPQAVTMYVNQSMEVPINLFNSNFTMNNLKLKATSPNEEVNIKLSKDFIPVLEPNKKEFITLTIDSFKTYGTYEVLIEAEAEATSTAEDGTEKISEFKEKAKLFINSLLKAEGNESQVNTKLAFAQDLLSTNPECLELNEFLKKASDKIEENNANEAGVLLDQVIESCKYLIAPQEKKPEIEVPQKVYGMPTESLFILGTVAGITLIVAISLIIGWAHVRAKKKELTKRKEL